MIKYKADIHGALIYIYLFSINLSKRYTHIILVWCTLHCNHRSGYLKTEHTERLQLLRRHLWNWSRGPAVSMTMQRMRNLDSSDCRQCMLCPCRVKINCYRLLKPHHYFVYALYNFNCETQKKETFGSYKPRWMILKCIQIGIFRYCGLDASHSE
jgi:hypothetical protein